MADPRALFAAEEIARARAYHRPRYLVWALGLALDLAILVAAAFAGLGDALADRLDGLPWWAQTLALTVAVVTLTSLATLPLAWWAGLRRERAWGFSTQSTRGWVADRAKGLGVELVLGCAALLGLVGLARALPEAWPLAAAGAGAALVVLLGFVAPLVLEPLFNRFTPLADEELAGALRQLAADAGVPVEHVLVADASRRTTKQNAYVSGLGHTRRLVVFDTLLAEADPRRLRVVLAHELGHRRAGHLVKGTALAVAGVVAFVGLLWALVQSQRVLEAAGAGGPGDPRIVPLVLLLAALSELAAAPAGAALSRRWEREADRLSLELTHDREGYVATHRALALANLADLDPPRLVYLALFTHPTPPERIAAAGPAGGGAARA